MPVWVMVTVQIVVSAASLVVEIVAGRMLAPHVGMSLYTWTSVIAVVLAGFSVGHWWGGRLADRPPVLALRQTGWLLLAAAVTTSISGTLLAKSAGPVLAATEGPIAGIIILTGVAFFLPSLFAGVPAPVLAKEATRQSARPGQALGSLFAAGAIGAIAGTLLAGFLFISWLGSTLTLTVVSLVYVATALVFLLASQTPIKRVAAATIIALILASAALAAPDHCTRESRYFCIRVVDVSANADSPAKMMILDHLVHGIGTRDAPEVMFTDHAAMLDALARIRMGRHDFSSFFIGGGTFSIPRAWAEQDIGPATVAEIDPVVVELASTEFWFDPTTAKILEKDARQALASDDARYDIIIGDAFTDIAVPPHLMTQEFFALVQSRLNPGGAYLMNVIDFEDRLSVLGAVIRTLKAEFEVVEVWTQQQRPVPGSRMVFVVVASDTVTDIDSFSVPAPDQTVFGALSQGFVENLAARETLILTDDYAPIDRLMGASD